MRELWSALADVAFPRWCPGCGAWDQFLCPECASSFEGGIVRVDDRAPYLRLILPANAEFSGLTRLGDEASWFPVYTLAEYSGAARKVIVPWKNAVNAGLTGELQGIIREQLGASRVLEQFTHGCGDELADESDYQPCDHSCNQHNDQSANQRTGQLPECGTPVSVVPAPSRGRKHRGLFVAGHIAAAVADACGGHTSDVLRVHRRRSTGKLIGRGNKSHGIYASSQPRSTRVILVDDVLTSGATLAGCARALEACGCEVMAAVVLAAAPDPRRGTGGNANGGTKATPPSLLGAGKEKEE